MDWKYKHFNREAVFNASRESVLDAARLTVAETLEGFENTSDGFVARGHGAWHAAIATFHITQAPEGTRVAVELLVERLAMRGYMLVDIGGYFNGHIDKWFSSIAQRLAGASEPILVSKTTSSSKLARGCITGCLVNLIVGACLVILAIPLDRLLFPNLNGPFQGPVSILASFFGFIAGISAFLYVMVPDAPAAQFVRERLRISQKKERN